MLRLKTGQSFKGVAFGAKTKNFGQIVFTTSLVGYVESMTDPSYMGQILVFSQPLIGNYGVPNKDIDKYGILQHFESKKISVQGIIIGDYSTKYNHWKSVQSLEHWCKESNVPILSGIDTRAIIHLLRENGSTMGEINSIDAINNEIPNTVVDSVSLLNNNPVKIYNKMGTKKIAVVDCGIKNNILRLLLKHNVQVHLVPWNYKIDPDKYDGVLISNGPGDPTDLVETIENIKILLLSPKPIPIFGICMGNLIMGLAAGFKTRKLLYGNRGHNQPVIDLTRGNCFITSQNHGYVIDDSITINNWEPYFRNINDNSNEGIRHKFLPFSAVQFHPEAKGGPQDTEYLINDFIVTLRSSRCKR
jgi:carbamoyl-phosphate synthase small subunit